MRPHQRPWISGLLLAVLGVAALLGPGHHALLPCLGDASACSSEADVDQGAVLTSSADSCPLCDFQSQHAPLNPTPPVAIEPAIVESLLHDVPLALIPQPRGQISPRAPPLAI